MQLYYLQSVPITNDLCKLNNADICVAILDSVVFSELNREERRFQLYRLNAWTIFKNYHCEMKCRYVNHSKY